MNKDNSFELKIDDFTKIVVYPTLGDRFSLVLTQAHRSIHFHTNREYVDRLKAEDSCVLKDTHCPDTFCRLSTRRMCIKHGRFHMETRLEPTFREELVLMCQICSEIDPL